MRAAVHARVIAPLAELAGIGAELSARMQAAALADERLDWSNPQCYARPSSEVTKRARFKNDLAWRRFQASSVLAHYTWGDTMRLWPSGYKTPPGWGPNGSPASSATRGGHWAKTTGRRYELSWSGSSASRPPGQAGAVADNSAHLPAANGRRLASRSLGSDTKPF